MSLADAIAEADLELPPVCPVATVRSALPEVDVATLDASLPGVSPDVLALALTRTGFRVAATDIQNHRAGTCLCVGRGT